MSGLPTEIGKAAAHQFKPYPAYKQSGVEWLGDVPEHWGIASLKWLCQRYAGGTPDKSKDRYWDEGTIPWINSGAVNQGIVTQPSTYITEEGFRNSSARWIPKNALVMALAGQGKTKGMVAQLGIHTTCNQSMAAIVPGEHVVSRFLFWWLSAQYTTIRNLAGGEQRDGLNLEILGSLPVPLLPLCEQGAIAKFLDRKTAELDALVAKKKALIERLQEKRSALISRTVTRGLLPEAACAAGLNPQPKHKPSGIEWLGDVPAHWKTSKIKYVARIESGHTPSRSVEEYWVDCTIPWISLNDSSYLREHDYISDTVYQINELGLANSSARMLPSGAVIFSRDATVGLCAITTRPMAVSQHFVAYLCGPKLLAPFLLFTLKAMGQHLERLSAGSTIVTIGMPEVKSLAFAVPPISEQKAIVEFIEQQTTKLDVLLAEVQHAIERLREYRAAVIAATVTGKIDVREQGQGESQLPTRKHSARGR
jgi:type I restriction enzyme, S subunit